MAPESPYHSSFPTTSHLGSSSNTQCEVSVHADKQQMKSSCDFFHCQFPTPSTSSAHRANPHNQVREPQQRAVFPKKGLHGTYPSYNPTAPDRFQGARQAEYPPVPFSELHHFTVQVLQANTVAPLHTRKTLIKSWNQLQLVDNLLILGNSCQARAALPQSLSR